PYLVATIRWAWKAWASSARLVLRQRWSTRSLTRSRAPAPENAHSRCRCRLPPRRYGGCCKGQRRSTLEVAHPEIVVCRRVARADSACCPCRRPCVLGDRGRHLSGDAEGNPRQVRAARAGARQRAEA